MKREVVKFTLSRWQLEYTLIIMSTIFSTMFIRLENRFIENRHDKHKYDYQDRVYCKKEKQFYPGNIFLIFIKRNLSTFGFLACFFTRA